MDSVTTAGRPQAGGVHLHPREYERYLARTPRSRELLAKTKPLIPTGHAGGMWYQMPYPVLLDRGKGTEVWDVDENEYLDLRIGDWVLIHGHANERIRAAVATQMERTSQFGSPEWDLSYRMASLIVDRMPAVDRVRFLASGTETNLLALRLARAHTGRAKLGKAQRELPRHRRHPRGRAIDDQLRRQRRPAGRHLRRRAGRRRVPVQRPRWRRGGDRRACR